MLLFPALFYWPRPIYSKARGWWGRQILVDHLTKQPYDVHITPSSSLYKPQWILWFCAMMVDGVQTYRSVLANWCCLLFDDRFNIVVSLICQLAESHPLTLWHYCQLSSNTPPFCGLIYAYICNFLLAILSFPIDYFISFIHTTILTTVFTNIKKE